MSEQRLCELCGLVAHDIVERAIEWLPEIVAAGGLAKRWEAVWRCPDYQACRARVEAKGTAWPIVDSLTQATVTPPVEQEVPV